MPVLRVRARVALAIALTVLLLCAGAVADVASAPRAVAATDCTKTLVAGLRGSGETAAQNGGYGPEVSAAITAFDQSYGSHVDSVAIDWISAPVNLDTMTKDLTYYFESINLGITKLTDLLRSRDKICPEQPIVVFGYSQGALAVNRVLLNFSLSTDPQLRRIFQRIVGVGLIADPARLGGRPYEIGSAWSSVNGVGQVVHRYTGDVPSDMRSRTVSTCNRFDVVCAFDPLLYSVPAPWTIVANLEYGIHVHTSYASNGWAATTGTKVAQYVIGAMRLVGDLNGDRVVGCQDVTIMDQEWGQVASGLPADLNHDGKVDISDLAILATHFMGDGRACQQDNLTVGQGSSTGQPFQDAYNRWGPAVLGSSINAVHTWGPGCIEDFRGGTSGQSALMQANCTGPVFVVQGDQWTYYRQAHGNDPYAIGYPTEDVHRWASGWSQQFGTGGRTPTTLMKGDNVGQVVPMWGGIARWYASLGGPASSYGYPKTDEYTFNGVPRRDFEGGSVVWVNGHVYNLMPVGAWAPNQQSYVNEFNAASAYAGMGFPDDYVHSWGPGCTQDFIGGYNTKSAIMSAGCSGAAYRVVGEQWAYLEGHAGANAAPEYGYPTNDVHRYGNGWTQDFSGGNRAWNLLMKGDHVGAVYDVLGGNRDKYLSQGGANGWLGYPRTDEYSWNGYICQNFEGDNICWSQSDGAELMNRELSIVDTPAFWGPSQYLMHITGLGFNNDMWRTYAEGAGNAAVNGAEWVGNIVGGRYRVDVFIPHNYATCVTDYYVRWNGGQTRVDVDQNAYNDQWVTLGTFNINGPQASVGSNDSTGTRGCQIGWDAIRWVKVG
jgi:hypothetical protein